jgi:hypothetical protein
VCASIYILSPLGFLHASFLVTRGEFDVDSSVAVREEEGQLPEVYVKGEGDLDELDGGLWVKGDGGDVELQRTRAVSQSSTAAERALPIPRMARSEHEDPEDRHGDGEMTGQCDLSGIWKVGLWEIAKTNIF